MDTRRAVGPPDLEGPAPTRGVARVALVALLVLGGFVGIRLALHDGDVSMFVLAGERVTDPRDAPPNLHVEPAERGYDGQAFYRLARNPATQVQREYGITFARPEYRHQRIGYPLLAWAVSGGGSERWVPTALVLVNLAAGVAIAALGARLALDARRSPWWGLVPAGWAGYLISVSLDLSEVVAGALLLAALLALRRERWAAAALILTAGALTRETTLLLAAAVLAVSATRLLRARFRPGPAAGPPIWVGLVPVAAYGAWRAVLHQWWADSGAVNTVSDDFLTVPFVRLGQTLADTVRDPASLGDVGFLQLLLTLAVVAMAVRSVADRSGPAHERLALVAFAALFVSSPVWNFDVTFLRWANDTVAVGWLLALGGSTRRLRSMAAVTALLWLLTAAVWAPFP